MTDYTSSLANAGNRRIWHACQAVLFQQLQTTNAGDESPTDGTALRGVQSIGINSSFDRGTYIDYGRFSRAYGSYSKPVYEVTIERVLDGSRNSAGAGQPFYIPAASPSSYENSHILNHSNMGLEGVSNSLRNYHITLLYGGENFWNIAAGNNNPTNHDTNTFADPTGLSPDQTSSPIKNTTSETTFRSCLITSIDYNIPVEGPVTESISFLTHNLTRNEKTVLSAYGGLSGYNQIDNATPIRRKHIMTEECVFPKAVERAFRWGITKPASLINPADRASVPILGLQNISISISFDWQDLYDGGEMGYRATSRRNTESKPGRQNKYKQLALPCSVTTEFEGTIADFYYGDSAKLSNLTQGIITDQLMSSEDGDETGGISKYEADQEIAIYGKVPIVGGGYNWMNWLIGKKNYLLDIGYSGGDASAGGSAVQATLTFQNDFGDFVPYMDTSKHNNPTAADIY